MQCLLGVQAGKLRQEEAAALSDGLLGRGSCQVALECQDFLLLPLGNLQLPTDHLCPCLLIRQGAWWVGVITGGQKGNLFPCLSEAHCPLTTQGQGGSAPTHRSLPCTGLPLGGARKPQWGHKQHCIRPVFTEPPAATCSPADSMQDIQNQPHRDSKHPALLCTGQPLLQPTSTDPLPTHQMARVRPGWHPEAPMALVGGTSPYSKIKSICP